MSTKQVTYKYSIDATGAEKTLGDIEKDYKRINKEIKDTVKGSDEYNIKIKELAGLKADIMDFRQEIEKLNPGDRIKIIGDLAKGAIAGYAGLTSAVATFAGSNEDLQRQLLKVNAALTLMQSAQSFLDFLDESKRLLSAMAISSKANEAAMKANATATEGATIATKSFATAFKAIGIGLVVAGIAALVANWEKVKKAVTDTFPALNNIGDLFDKLMQKLYGVGNVIKKVFQGDFDIAANYAEGVANKIADQLQEANDKLKASALQASQEYVEVLKARGKDTYEIERVNLQNILDLNKDNAKEYAKILQQIRILDATHAKQQEDAREAEYKKLQEDLKKRNEEIQKAEEERLRILIEANSKVLTANQQQQMDVLNEIINNGAATTEIESTNYSERLGQFNEFAPKLIESVHATNKAVTDSERARAEAELTIGKELLTQKESVMASTADLLKSGAALAGESTKTGKALAIASSLITTYQSAVSAYASAFLPTPTVASPFLGAVYAAAAVAAGLANVAAIKRTNVNSTSVSSAGVPVSYSPPKIPTASVVTNLSQESITGVGNSITDKPIQVSVGISEISNTQQRVNNYERSAQLG